MNGAPILNENHEIDYSDAHQVIKALTERNIPEQAAEVLIAYGRFQAELAQREIDRNYATKEEFRAIQSRQEHIEESQNSHATKHDVEMVKLELQKEIENSKLELQKEIENSKLELQKEINNNKLELQKEINDNKLEIQNSKLEIQNNKLELQKDIEVNRLSLQKEIIESSKKTIRWMVGTMLVHTALIIGVISALTK